MQNGQLDMLQIKIDRARDALPKQTRRAIDSVDWRAYILSLREKKGYSFEQLEDLELETELLLCGLLNPSDYPDRLEEEMKLPRPQVDLLVEEMNQFVFKKIKDELIKNTERESVFVKKDDSITNEQLRITNLNTKNSPPPNLPLTKGEELGGGLNTSNVIAVEEHKISPNVTAIKIEKSEEPKLSNQTTIEVMPTEISAPTVKAPEKTIEPHEKEILSKAGIEIPHNEIVPPKIEQKTPPISIPPKTEEKKEVKTTTEPIQKTDTRNFEPLLSQKLSGSFQMPNIKTEYTLPSLGKDKTTPIQTDKIRNSDPYREIPE